MRTAVHPQRYLYLSCALMLVFTVFSARQGIAATPPVSVCKDDIWTCTEWSSCSSQGVQTRVCTMTLDCPGVATPQPAEQRSCVAADLNREITLPVQQRKLTTKQSACTEDAWSCGAWQPCGPEGRQERLCLRTFDCPFEDTPEPESIRECQDAQCEHIKNMRSRILCRLRLNHSALEQEFNKGLVPEECRVLRAEGDIENCSERVRLFRACRQLAAEQERSNCALGIVGARNGIVAAVRKCQGQPAGAERAACMQTVKSQAFAMIQFRFSDLADRAWALLARGASETTVLDFTVEVELKKQEFQRAASKEERRQIILDVRKAWFDFVARVTDEIKQAT